MSVSMRDQMPKTAAFVDALRQAFGPDQVNGPIRRGLAGEPEHFIAREGGHQIGTDWDRTDGVVPHIQETFDE